MSTIEFSIVEMSVLHGLKTGSEVLKQINKEMSLEDVEKLMEETQEARAYQEVGRGPPIANWQLTPSTGNQRHARQ